MNLQRTGVAILVGAFCWATTHVLAAAPSAGSATGVASARLAVEGMSCASCSVAAPMRWASVPSILSPVKIVAAWAVPASGSVPARKAVPRTLSVADGVRI